MALTKKIEKNEFTSMISDYQKRCCVNGHWQRGKWSSDVCEIVFDSLEERNEEINSLEEVVSRFQTITVKEWEIEHSFGIARKFAEGEKRSDKTGEVTAEIFLKQLDKEYDLYIEMDWTADVSASLVGVERLNTWEHNSPLDQTLVFEAA